MKPDPKEYMMYDFIHDTMGKVKLQERKAVSGCQGHEVKEEPITKGNLGEMELFYILSLVVDTYLQASVTTRRNVNKSEFYNM